MLLHDKNTIDTGTVESEFTVRLVCSTYPGRLATWCARKTCVRASRN